VFVILSLSCFGAPLDCVHGTLADYAALEEEGCRLGTRVLSGFALGPTGGSPIPSSAITVSPSVAGLTGSLLFAFDNASASAGQVLQTLVFMSVDPDNDLGEIVSLQLTGATATGNGVVTGVAELCNGFFAGVGTCSGPSTAVVTLVSATDNLPFDSQSIGPASIYSLSHDIVVDGSPDGSASLAAAQLTFTSIPEPGTAGALAIGLTCLVLLRRRLNS
jgi:hypothetical protein